MPASVIKTLCLTTSILISCIVHAQPNNNDSLFKKADSFYFASDWNNAVKLYKQLLKDTSTNSIAWQRLAFAYYNLGKPADALMNYQKAEASNPPAAMQPYLYSRMAKVYSLQNDETKAIAYLDKACNAGYFNLKELDTAKEFIALKNDTALRAVRTKVYNLLYPCESNPHNREFDFWAGEWDVYATGSATLVGHSLVQIISNGCALLENWDSPASSGKSINFIDPNTDKWKQSWAGSYANGVQEFINGEYKDSAMRFDFETKDAQGKKITGRFIFYNLGPGKVRQFNETSADDGKTWTTSYDFTYIRKK